MHRQALAHKISIKLAIFETSHVLISPLEEIDSVSIFSTFETPRETAQVFVFEGHGYGPGTSPFKKESHEEHILCNQREREENQRR